MTPNNNPRIVASYHDGTRRIVRPVIGWDEDWRALVASEDGYASYATSHTGFIEVTADEYEHRIVQIMPSGGWRVSWRNDDGPVITAPLVGWGLTAAGDVLPLDTDGEGLVLELTGCTGYTILPPEAA